MFVLSQANGCAEKMFISQTPAKKQLPQGSPADTAIYEDIPGEPTQAILSLSAPMGWLGGSPAKTERKYVDAGDPFFVCAHGVVGWVPGADKERTPVAFHPQFLYDESNPMIVNNPGV